MERVCHVTLPLKLRLIFILLLRYIEETIRLDKERYNGHVEQGMPFSQTTPPSFVPSYHRDEHTQQGATDRTDTMDDILNALG